MFLLKSFILCILVELSGYARAFAQEQEQPPEREEIEKHVFFMLFRGGDIREDGKRVGVGNLQELESSKFDPKLPTKIFVHAFMRSHRIGAGVYFLRAYFRSKRYEKGLNVVLVDYSKFSDGIDFLGPQTRILMELPYLRCVKHVHGVGEYVGKFIQFLVEEGGAKWEDIHLIGFSLGAQVAGSVGRATGGKIARITGLDPAGPCFERFLFLCDYGSENIGHTSAQFVDIIHTDSELLGISKPAGHVDFYPNGGSLMPGCPDIQIIPFFPPILGGVCSHLKAVEFWEESILNEGDFVAHNCESYQLFKSGECATQAVASMGDGCDPKSVQGKYYLETNENSPHAKGKGIITDFKESETSDDDYVEFEDSDDEYEESDVSDDYVEDYMSWK